MDHQESQTQYYSLCGIKLYYRVTMAFQDIKDLLDQKEKRLYIYMLNKNTLGVKKVRGQEEAAL